MLRGHGRRSQRGRQLCPSTPFLRLAAGSPLVDKGTDVGLPFAGSAPDLGCFETGLVFDASDGGTPGAAADGSAPASSPGSDDGAAPDLSVDGDLPGDGAIGVSSVDGAAPGNPGFDGGEGDGPGGGASGCSCKVGERHRERDRGVTIALALAVLIAARRHAGRVARS